MIKPYPPRIEDVLCSTDPRSWGPSFRDGPNCAGGGVMEPLVWKARTGKMQVIPMSYDAYGRISGRNDGIMVTTYRLSLMHTASSEV